jgi:hypothetical protein
MTRLLKITIPIVVVLLAIIAVTGIVLVKGNGSSALASPSGTYSASNLNIASGNGSGTYGCCRGVLGGNGQGGWSGDDGGNLPPCCRDQVR